MYKRKGTPPSAYGGYHPVGLEPGVADVRPLTKSFVVRNVFRIFGLRFFWLIRLFYFVVVSGKGCLYLGIPFPFYCNEIRL